MTHYDRNPDSQGHYIPDPVRASADVEAFVGPGEGIDWDEWQARIDAAWVELDALWGAVEMTESELSEAAR